MVENIFKKIINGEIPSKKIYEDENHLAFLDITPFEKGHTLVIPKKEYVTIFDMPEDEFLELMRVVKKVATNIKRKINCDMNICQNNGELSGQEVPHVHFHLIPRKENKKIYNLNNKTTYKEGEIDEYSNKLYFN